MVSSEVLDKQMFFLVRINLQTDNIDCFCRATTFVLEVDTTNEGAIALYESQGFKRTTVRADYYKPGHDALLMELRL